MIQLKNKTIKIQNQRRQCEENIVCRKFYLFGDIVKRSNFRFCACPFMEFLLAL